MLQCAWEPDLLDALAAARWPHRADPALRAHVASCRICADVADVAAAFLSDREPGDGEAPVPPSSLVWWRAQVRAREESARLVGRPIAMVQAAATICVALASMAAAPAAAAWLRQIVSGLGATEWWAMPQQISLSWLLGAATYTTLPLVAVGLWILVAPVVVYFALDE